MSAHIKHSRIHLTMKDGSSPLFAMIGDQVNDPQVSPLRNLRHVRQNPDLGRAQLASLLRAGRRHQNQDVTSKAGKWQVVLSDIATRSANDTLPNG